MVGAVRDALRAPVGGRGTVEDSPVIGEQAAVDHQHAVRRPREANSLTRKRQVDRVVEAFDVEPDGIPDIMPLPGGGLHHPQGGVLALRRDHRPPAVRGDHRPSSRADVSRNAGIKIKDDQVAGPLAQRRQHSKVAGRSVRRERDGALWRGIYDPLARLGVDDHPGVRPVFTDGQYVEWHRHSLAIKPRGSLAGPRWRCRRRRRPCRRSGRLRGSLRLWRHGRGSRCRRRVIRRAGGKQRHGNEQRRKGVRTRAGRRRGHRRASSIRCLSRRSPARLPDSTRCGPHRRPTGGEGSDRLEDRLPDRSVSPHRCAR